MIGVESFKNALEPGEHARWYARAAHKLDVIEVFAQAEGLDARGGLYTRTLVRFYVSRDLAAQLSEALDYALNTEGTPV